VPRQKVRASTSAFVISTSRPRERTILDVLALRGVPDGLLQLTLRAVEIHHVDLEATSDDGRVRRSQ